jgi:membrane protease YdiL (CAAX protease family)
MDEQAPKQYRSIKWGPLQGIVVATMLYIAAQIIGAVAAYIYPLLQGWSVDQAMDWLTDSIIAQFVFVFSAQAATLLILGWYLRSKKNTFSDIGLKKPKLSDAGKALIGYGVYFSLFLLAVITAKAAVPGIDLEQEQQLGFAKDVAGLGLLVVFVSLVILPPLVEEIVVRGFMFSGLRTKLTFLQAAVVSSVIFGLAHLQWGSDAPLLWIAAIDTFVLGMVLAYLREKTGSLAAPIILHALKNGIAFSLLFVFNVA